jgi:hypothetical protein
MIRCAAVPRQLGQLAAAVQLYRALGGSLPAS